MIDSEKLTELIRQHTPEFVSSWPGEDGSAKHWGFVYPQLCDIPKPERDKMNREQFEVYCIRALNKMEEQVKDIFGTQNITFNERDNEAIDEAKISLKDKVAKIGAKLLGISYENARKYIGLFEGTEPTQQRMILFGLGDKKVSYSVSTKRHLRVFSGGGEIFWPGKGYTSFEPIIPVIISFHGFERGDRNYAGLNRELSKTVFGEMRREFPYIHGVPPSTLWKPEYLEYLKYL